MPDVGGVYVRMYTRGEVPQIVVYKGNKRVPYRINGDRLMARRLRELGWTNAYLRRVYWACVYKMQKTLVDEATEFAGVFGITVEQLDNMSDAEFEAMYDPKKLEGVKLQASEDHQAYQRLCIQLDAAIADVESHPRIISTRKAKEKSSKHSATKRP